jgi:hypothetical protein
VFLAPRGNGQPTPITVDNQKPDIIDYRLPGFRN